ncbi:MAG: FtsX-like permease family protein [Phycisphaerae bacterium]|nr:FtsX-like permease family protein [Phycisphaerae bacterium]
MKTLPLEYSLRGLTRGRGRTLLALAGSLVAGALIATASAFLGGMEAALGSTASPSRVIVMGAGSEESLERSEIGARVPGVLSASVQGIKRTAGMEHVSAETHVALPIAIDGAEAASDNGLVRGVGPAALLVHPNVQLTGGRWPERGSGEVLAGTSAMRRLGVDPSTAIGSRIVLAGTPLTIVGTMRAPGSTIDGEWWMPLEDLTTLMRRETISCVIVDLDGATIGDVRAFTVSRLDLELAVLAELDYYASLLAFFTPVRALVAVVATLMALAAALGGASALAAAFSERVRENAVLETLGYPRHAVILDVLLQCIIVAVSGATAGGFLAKWLLSGLLVEFSMGTFALQFDARSTLLAVATGFAVAIVAAVLSTWRWIGLPTPEALRTT